MSQKTLLYLDDNEIAEIRWAQLYTKEFHHRTPGASRLFLISKLSKACGITVMNDKDTSVVVMDEESPIKVIKK